METPELYNSYTNGLPDAPFSSARLSWYRQTAAPRTTPRPIDMRNGEIPISAMLERQEKRKATEDGNASERGTECKHAGTARQAER